MKKLRKYKIVILSLVIIVFSVFIVFQKKSVTVSIYIDGDKANMVNVIDLSLDYNENNLNLISYSPEGILKKVDAKHFLLMPNPDLSKPIIQLRFETSNLFVSTNIKVDEESQVYLSNLGIISLPSTAVNFKLKYE